MMDKAQRVETTVPYSVWIEAKRLGLKWNQYFIRGVKAYSEDKFEPVKGETVTKPSGYKKVIGILNKRVEKLQNALDETKETKRGRGKSDLQESLGTF